MFHLKESMKNINWRNYAASFGLAGFALLLIFGNFKSQSYYANIKAAKKQLLQNDSQIPSFKNIQSIDAKSLNCTFKSCIVTCSGDMKSLKSYLANQKSCSSIQLQISGGIFPDEKLQSNWLEGSSYLSSIKISLSKLSGIEDGAFNQLSVAYVSQLELSDVQLENLTDRTFVGLKTIGTFTLVNRVETFSGEGLLKPMMKTLKKLVIKHVTNIPTDPGTWLRGENFSQLTTIIFDGSNFGGYINAATFQHLKKLSILTMDSCKFTSIADGSFDFMMSQMVVLISLQNNQLKRLDGKYLSSVNSLRRLDIRSNPWNCTCKLEHLVRVFKDYPEGFGQNSTCNTPQHLAGKLLNEIDITICEYEPLSSLEPITSTLKPTTDRVSTALSSSSTALASSINTTPSPQNRTTTLSSDSIFVECKRYKLRFTNYPPNILELSPPDGSFRIVTISETSVRMIFEGPYEDLVIIWFYGQSSFDESGRNVPVAGEFNVGCLSELDTSLIVEGLVENQAYIFCLVKNGTKVISPFNCQSYFSTRPADTNDIIWLRKRDMPLVICVFVASILVSVFFGLIGMFLLMRCHPGFLRGSKQNKVGGNQNFGENRRNVTNSITESSFGNSFNSSANFRRFSTESGLSYMLANNYEELDNCKRLFVINDLILSNRVPRSPAPPLPKRIRGNGNQRAETMEERNVHVMEPTELDDGYTRVV